MPRGKPQLGDRSAYDAANYPDIHTNDTNTDTGIHHTPAYLDEHYSKIDHIHDLVSPENGWVKPENYSALCNGVKTNFSTAYPFANGSTLIWLNGVLQTLGTDYSEAVDQASITFNAPAPFTGDKLILTYMLATGVVPPDPPSPPPPPPPVGTVWTVPLTTSVVDGRVAPWNGVVPGDTLELTPGIRGTLNIRNISGTALAPITIRNGDGVVDMNTSSGWVGYYLQNDHHIRISGHFYGQTYGLKITKCVGFGILGKNKTDNIEIDHVEAIEIKGTNSIAFHILTNAVPADQVLTHSERYDYDGDGIWDTPITRENYILNGVKIHDCHIDGGAGTYKTLMATYIGNSNYLNDLDEPTLTNVDIYNNLFENIGGGKVLQVGSVINNTLNVYKNTILNSCNLGTSEFIAININPGVGGRVHENIIRDCVGKGINFMSRGGKIDTNLLVRVGKAGTYYDAGIAVIDKDVPHNEATQVLQNTIIDAVGNAIEFADGINGITTVQNNILCSPGGSYVSYSGANFTVDHNLQVANVSDVGFVNAGTNNYHLTNGSSARNGGVDVSGYNITTDLDGVALDASPDIGCYQYI